MIEPAAFRATLGLFASGVTVVTARDGTGGAVHGMTASAFMSVSLAPPLVVVGIGNGARQHAIVAAAGHYGVTILAAGQEADALRFAGRPREGMEPPQFVEQAGVPVLADGLASLATRVVAAHPAGDHTLFVGEVVAIGMHDPKRAPLAYQSGGFHHLTRPLRGWPLDPMDPWLGSLSTA